MNTQKNSAEAKRSSAGGAQNRFKRRENTVAVEYCAFTARTGDKNTCREYKKEATIQNKLRTEKCDAYKANEILGYRRKILCISSKRRRKPSGQQ